MAKINANIDSKMAKVDANIDSKMAKINIFDIQLLINLNSSVDFSRRDAEAQRMLDICVVLSFRPKQDGFANLHLVGEKH